MSNKKSWGYEEQNEEEKRAYKKGIKSERLRNKKDLEERLVLLREKRELTFKDQFETREQLTNYINRVEGKIDLLEEFLNRLEKEPEKEGMK